MRSWVFRNRSRLEAIYLRREGLPSARKERARAASERVLVLQPAPRRARPPR